MKTIMLAIAILVSMYSGSISASEVCSASSDVIGKPTFAVKVLARDQRGSESIIGTQTTNGTPLKFTTAVSYPVATNGGSRAGYDGQWSMTICNFRQGLADSEYFDVAFDGKYPSLWDGSVVVHLGTGTGSHKGTVHWVDGVDYVIDVTPIQE